MKKLFDVKNNKFGELGKDWLGGGDFIVCNNDLLCEIKKTCKAYHSNCDYNSHPYTLGEMCQEGIFMSQKYKNITHELNEKWDGIFKGCVYGENGEYVVVDSLTCKYDNHTIHDGDVVRNMKHTGFVRSARSGECIANVDDYYTKQNYFYSKITNNTVKFEPHNFEEVLTKIRTDEKFANEFFTGLAKSDVKIAMQQPKEKIEAYYFQQKVVSGLYTIGNILTEYSKSLVGDKNKLNEWTELLKS